MLVQEHKFEHTDFSLDNNKFLIVGLGNPGNEYLKTWHNAGFMFIDEVITMENLSQLSFETKFNAETNMYRKNSKKIYLLKPQTFMNNSGQSVKQIAKFYDIQTKNIILVHDDLDIEFGKYKISFGKGPKIHNGVNSVENHLSSTEFWRVRLGVETRSKELKTKFKGSDYVLSKIGKDDLEKFSEVFSNAYSAISII